MPNIGPMEVAIVAIIALLILGPRKLPDAGRALGRGMREFKEGITGAGERAPVVAERAEVAPASAPE